jgi:hypothetical protein
MSIIRIVSKKKLTGAIGTWPRELQEIITDLKRAVLI